MPAQTNLDQRIAEVRRFNRFYTRQIGVLNEGLLRSPFSVAEARVLYELAQRDKPTASALRLELNLDAGYLSRILRDFERRGLIRKKRAAKDGRQSLLSLTARGSAAFARLNGRSHEEVRTMLSGLSEAEQSRMVEAMQTIGHLLGLGLESPRPSRPAHYILRPRQPGDMGWVIERHGVLYAREYGLDEKFEGLVAGIVARFLERYDPKLERCWIAEREGAPVGSVFLVAKSARVAQLRMLLVEPHARGLGIGRRLVDECIRFARQAGYRKVILWTNDILVSARRIYEAAGFRLAEQKPHQSFGQRLVGQTWELNIESATGRKR
jgi:DNA-binding MarR family transcriptional regulator/N-acetylglutamate synthase-like GNAT family acetyltransferase